MLYSTWCRKSKFQVRAFHHKVSFSSVRQRCYVFSDGLGEWNKKNFFFGIFACLKIPTPRESPQNPLMQRAWRLKGRFYKTNIRCPKEDLQEHPRGRPRPPRLPPLPRPFLWRAKGPRVEGGVGGDSQAPKEDTVRVGHEAVRQHQKKNFFFSLCKRKKAKILFNRSSDHPMRHLGLSHKLGRNFFKKSLFCTVETRLSQMEFPQIKVNAISGTVF